MKLPLQEMETFTWQRRDPREPVAHPHCFARHAAEHQPWRQCWFVHEAQQADKKVAPPRVTDLKFQRSEAVSSGGTRSSHGGGRGCPCRAISSKDGLALAAQPLWLCRDTPAAPWGAYVTHSLKGAAQPSHPLAQTRNAMGSSLKGEHCE